MLKRVRSQSDSSSGKVALSKMSNGHAPSGDRKRSCALTSEACEILNNLRKKNLLCDAKISTKRDHLDPDAEFPVHRFILAGKIRK